MKIGLKAFPGGLWHLSKGLLRVVLLRPRTYYHAYFQRQKLDWHPAAADNGRPRTCPMCGYVKIKVVLPAGWSVEMCSALPRFTDMEALNASLVGYQKAAAELPTAAQSSYTVTDEQRNLSAQTKQPQQQTRC